jgi:hypothetical protein
VTETDWAELIWRKSSRSAEQNCVNVAFRDDAVLIRDSKDPNGPFLELAADQWDAFLRTIKRGDFA